MSNVSQFPSKDNRKIRAISIHVETTDQALLQQLAEKGKAMEVIESYFGELRQGSKVTVRRTYAD